jgi:hypothetical protein
MGLSSFGLARRAVRRSVLARAIPDPDTQTRRPLGLAVTCFQSGASMSQLLPRSSKLLWAAALTVLAFTAVGCKPGTGVGDPCDPESVPGGGFDRQEVYLETSSVQCRTRVCMVYEIAGLPDDSDREPRERVLHLPLRRAGRLQHAHLQLPQRLRVRDHPRAGRLGHPGWLLRPRRRRSAHLSASRGPRRRRHPNGWRLFSWVPRPVRARPRSTPCAARRLGRRT